MPEPFIVDVNSDALNLRIRFEQTNQLGGPAAPNVYNCALCMVCNELYELIGTLPGKWRHELQVAMKGCKVCCWHSRVSFDGPR